MPRRSHWPGRQDGGQGHARSQQQRQSTADGVQPSEEGDDTSHRERSCLVGLVRYRYFFAQRVRAKLPIIACSRCPKRPLDRRTSCS